MEAQLALLPQCSLLPGAYNLQGGSDWGGVIRNTINMYVYVWKEDVLRGGRWVWVSVEANRQAQGRSWKLIL